MARPWFRCYLDPCDGSKRTDTDWRSHWHVDHGGDAMAVERGPGTDLLPAPRTGPGHFVDRGGQVSEGKAAFRAALDELRRRHA